MPLILVSCSEHQQQQQLTLPVSFLEQQQQLRPPHLTSFSEQQLMPQRPVV